MTATAPTPTAASQRERMLAGMASAVTEKGYARAVVTDVVERAGVSRKTFYEQFSDKEDCFVALYEACMERLRERLAAVLDPALTAREQGGALIAAYLEFLAQEPELARTYLVEAYSAGPRAIERRQAFFEEIAAVIRGLHARLIEEEDAGVPELDDLDYELLVGGIVTAATVRVAAGRTAELPGIAPELTAFVLRGVGAP